MITVDPMAFPVEKRFCATVVPRTAAFATWSTSAAVKNRPWATAQFRTVCQAGVLPLMDVYQFVPPATACALVCEDGAAAATSGTSCAIAVTSPSCREVLVPDPCLTPAVVR